MSPSLLALLLVALAGTGFVLGRWRAMTTVGGAPRLLHSRPRYHGLYVAIWTGVPAFLVLVAWQIFEPGIARSIVLDELGPGIAGLSGQAIELLMNDILNAAAGVGFADPGPEVARAAQRYNDIRATGATALTGLALAVGFGGLALGLRFVSPVLRARNAVERFVMVLLIASSTLAIFTTAGIVLSLLFEAIRFFRIVPVHEFLFGLEWSPQTAIRADQVGSSGAFGAVPVFAGTLLITVIAMTVAIPVGLLSAIWLAEYATPRTRNIVKPLMEILAGIPTVVYGFFAALTVAPLIRALGQSIGLDAASESALAAGLVMGVMIIPFVSSLSDDVINAVPGTLREGSWSLGATQAETIRQVVLPAALPGIVGAILLAVSRAIGETMIVVMAAGLAANLTGNPFAAVTTITVQIVTLLVGDQEFDSVKTLSAFALGLLLFIVTLGLNVIALYVVRRYRERYD